MENQLHGVMTIKDGKVMLLKNVTDMNAAIIGGGNPVHVFKALSDAGWKLYGDYELRIYKNVPAPHQGQESNLV